MKRELGLERCKTVWSLSASVVYNIEFLFPVREDQNNITYNFSIVKPIAVDLLRYVFIFAESINCDKKNFRHVIIII
jgi:hypothetical protein